MPKVNYVYWYHLASQTDVNTQGYVGVTSDLKGRDWTHKRGKRGYATILRNAFTKYGEDKVLKDILFTGTQVDAYDYEESLRPVKNIGWNIAIGGGLPPDCTGRKHSEESIRKMVESNRIAKLGKVYPNKFKGVTDRHSEETKALIGSYHKGKVISEEQKKSMSIKLSGEANYRAKEVFIFHISDLSKIHIVNTIGLGCALTGLSYSGLRSLTQRLSIDTPIGVSRAGWGVCLENDTATLTVKYSEHLLERSTHFKTMKKSKGAKHTKAKSVTLEHIIGEVKTFPTILAAAEYIGLKDSSLRYIIKQSEITGKHSNYSRKVGWRVLSNEVEG